MDLKERLERKNRKINEETGKMSIWHSSFYHNHFAGCAEYRMAGKDGAQGKIKHIYVAEYYRQELYLHQKLILRMIYGFLYFGAAGTCIYAACLPAESNRIWYVNLMQAFLLPCLFRMFIAMISYISGIGDMRKRKYVFSVVGIRRGAFLTGSLLIITAVFVALSYRTCPESIILRSGVLFFLAGLQMFAVFLIERQMPYRMIENAAVVPPDSVIL